METKDNKLFGIKKPTAYYVYGSIYLIIIVALIYFIYKKFYS